MTWKTKTGIIIPVTLIMGFGFFMMMRKNLSVPCMILAIVWICHIIYFIFGVKTIKTAGSEAETLKEALRTPAIETAEGE